MIRITPICPYMVEHICDNCNTEMVLNRELLSSPPHYEMVCPKCGNLYIASEEEAPGIHYSSEYIDFIGKTSEN